MCHCANLYNNIYNNNFLFDTLLTQLFVILLTTEADRILVDCHLLPFAFLYAHTFNLQNVLKVYNSWYRLLKNCVCAFSYLSVPLAYCWWFIWKAFNVFGSVFCVHTAFYCVWFLCEDVMYVFSTHDLCFCSFCLLLLVLNDIRSIRFP